MRRSRNWTILLLYHFALYHLEVMRKMSNQNLFRLAELG